MKKIIYLFALSLALVSCSKDDDNNDPTPTPTPTNPCESDQFIFRLVDGQEYYIYEYFDGSGWFPRSVVTFTGNECDSTSEIVYSNGIRPPLVRFKKDYVMLAERKAKILFENSDSILLETDTANTSSPEFRALSFK